MKVLHLINAFNRGGLESWLLTMLRTVPRDVCAMDVCCKANDEGPWAYVARQLGAQVFECPFRPSHLGFLRGLEKILRDGNYDVVHNHLAIYSGFPVWISHRMGVPVISTFHATAVNHPYEWWLRLPVLRSLRSLYGWISIRYALRNSELVTAVSKGVLQGILTLYREIPRKSRVVYLGVPVRSMPDSATRVSLRESLELPWESPLILHVGRFTPEKNHRGIIEVFGLVLKKLPDSKLLLVGDGPLRPAIARLVDDKNLAESVTFYGNRDDVPALMSACDVFLFPSTNEGLPVAVLEAAGAGLPVVGTRIPGLLEALEDERTALLHHERDVQGMADSVISILTNPEYARELGAAGRTRVLQEFSDDVAAKRLVELYSECRRTDGGKPAT